MNHTLKKGMTLYCKNGETVVLTDFNENRIEVEYKGKKYGRPITSIQEKLFLENPCARATSPSQLKNVSDPPPENTRDCSATSKSVPTITKNPPLPRPEEERERSCENCKFQVAGDCSSWNLCEDYQPVYRISKKEMSYWPQEGDATRFKRKGSRR